jgi:chromate reductase, NAD(P)H dehydrogenase (quinone)
MLILLASQGANRDLAEQLLKVGQSLGQKAEVLDLVDLNLPLYSAKAEEVGLPEAAKELTAKLLDASSLVVVAPEYNGSIPPVFNNAIAWVSRSGGTDWRAAFNGKVAALATHSGGGGQKVLMAIRGQLEHLGCTCVARTLLTNPNKPLSKESAESVLGLLKKLSS